MEINLPDSVLLSLIKPKNLHSDRKSFEKKTGITKTKFKLFRKKILSPLNLYIFFVITTNPNACERFFTLTITPSDWLNLKTGHLQPKTSYLDIRKLELLEEKEILIKSRDTGNKFIRVAELSDNKFNELKTLYAQSHQNPVNVSADTKHLIEVALLEADVENRVLQNLGLL